MRNPVYALFRMTAAPMRCTGTNYKLLLCTALAFGLSIVALSAQTPVEDLQNAVEQYNALREYQNGFTPKTINTEALATMKSRMEKGVSLLDKVIREGNSEQIKTARYFIANFRYQYAFMLGMKGENAQSYEVMKSIESDFMALTASDFPLRYKFFEKNYIVKWEDYAPTQAEYYVGFGETAYNTGKYADALQLIRLSLNHSHVSTWLKYVSVNKLLDINAKNSAFLTDQERLDYAVQAIKMYDALSDKERKTVAEYNYPTVKRGMDLVLAQAQRGNSAPLAGRCAEIAPIAAKYEPNNPKVLQLYEVCYRNNHAGDRAFHTAAQEYAKQNLGADRLRAEFIGVAAIGRIAALTAETDCAGWSSVSEMYAGWGKSDRAAEYAQKAGKCLDDAEKARKKAERTARRANSSFNLYAGAYLLPLINSNPKRDYGGVLNFAFRRSAWEFSYLGIHRNKENIFDLWIREVEGAKQDNISRWDGYYAHVQPKFFAGKREFSYVGVLLGYAEKNFDSLSVTVVRDLDGIPSQQVFNPKVNQYIFMLTFGIMPLMKGFGMDFYWSIGANYSRFDPGNELDREAYTIDNPLLENRKDAYFGFIMRAGCTIGLNFGRGNH